ncbi:1-phosphofructokinase family hexose kinase [Mycolicibacterium austroafricanum]|uniref:1-phosphofructokinase family hexose kinase n=1 Tax=Mycolicibacterium austroafricanum TaxID=39687 RepID=UPI001CA377DB|nr:1-phosphofructokinase family hexose kinase [Mycolicibacterium austroafricanum]QZT55297.1 1-phosphofructokinase family hexose kinase [Mycolicibacterium austroafricanum]
MTDITNVRSPVSGSRIVTLTMNPALDIATSTEIVMPTEKMRCSAARYDPGGGGINVARVARTLGASVVALFPAGGASGDLFADMLEAIGISAHMIPIAGSTRESITVNELRTQRQYRFVLPGPTLTAAEQTECLNQLREVAASADFVVASGSLPPGVSPEFYNRIADVCAQLDAPLVLDASGGGLQHLTGGNVYLLKPSIRELRECVRRELGSEAEQVAAARELIERGGARNVLVSLGAQGALLVTADGAQRYPAVEVPPGSGVGAGDAMVAGVTCGLGRGWALPKSVRLGIAAGAAMLMTPGTASCTRADVERLFDRTPDPVDLTVPAADR